MPCHERTNVDQNREPEGIDKALLACLVAQELLCKQCPRPTPSKGEYVKRLLCDSPATRYRCGFVEGVRQERQET